uniref:SH2 domain-containing protein n=2 Tax=Ciona intestinalis TaxID=7719 RepID=F7ANQ1_CIOIN
MEKEEAERRLGSSVCDPGTYLIRFSDKEASKGGFVFSIKVTETTIRHYMIEGKPDTACNGNEYDAKLVLLPVQEGKENETFPNLVTLVEDRIRMHEFDGVKAKYVCRDLQFNAVFKGYKKTT